MYKGHIYKSKENDDKIMIVYPSHVSLAMNDPDIWDAGACRFRIHGP